MLKQIHISIAERRLRFPDQSGMTLSAEGLKTVDYPRIGSRVLISGRHFATLLYVGPVSGQSGEWAGLEWDDPTRGKHDGSHNGHRYFQPQLSHSKACSFVRLPKLLETADFGITLEEALQQRYYTLSASDKTLQLHLANGGQLEVEVKGEGATALRSFSASLIGMRISDVFSHMSVYASMQFLMELDLSNNLIGNWGDVVTLLNGLPKLSMLNVSSNRLDESSLCQTAKGMTLKALVVNSCAMTWSHLLGIGAQFPCLERLHACNNDLEKLGKAPEETVFERLELLDLEKNKLYDWRDIESSLGHLPALHTLQLSFNQLEEIEVTGHFLKLSSLLLGSNKIANASSVDALNEFPSLVETRLSDNPSLPCQRFELVGRLKNIRRLNGSDISKSERRDCELAYLRAITDQGFDTSKHPRYTELVTAYGPLIASTTRAGQGIALAHSMVRVTLSHGNTCIVKKLPLSLSIGRLKIMVEKLLGVKEAKQCVLLCHGGREENVTDAVEKELKYYELPSEGVIIRVIERDEVTRLAAQKAALERRAHKEEEQERILRELRAEEAKLLVGS